MNPLIAYLESQSIISHLVFSTACVFIIGYVDAVILPREISLLLLYLLPVVQVTFFAGFRAGVFISVLASLTTFIADSFDFRWFQIVSSDPFGTYINVILTMGVFIVAASLTGSFKKSIDTREDKEIELARTDYTTSSANRKYFFELVNLEIHRSHRYKHPFTVIYFDIDNFKVVNEMYGHHVGDTLLCAVVETIRLNVRNVDTVARFGDDEFAILLPETGYEQAKTVTDKLKTRLNDAMHRLDWPVSFSIGIVTCETKPGSADEIMGIADKLVYDVKKNGKNSIKHEVYNK